MDITKSKNDLIPALNLGFNFQHLQLFCFLSDVILEKLNHFAYHSKR